MKYQESVDGNVEETCETVAETRRLSRISALGLVTFTCCCGHSGTLLPFYMSPSGFS